jgi:site-specific DNA-cytosine methylase
VAFAGSGKHEGACDDRMVYLRRCAYQLGLALEPSIWCWELVPAILTKGRPYLDAMAYRAKMSGYRCYGWLTSSALHGGFQDRRRFHFVASRYDLDFEGVYEREPPERKQSYTLGDALTRTDTYRKFAAQRVGEVRPLGLENDVDLYRGAFRDIMPFCPPGAHLQDVPDQLMEMHYRPRGQKWNGRSRPGFTHTRGRMDRPSPNVLGGHTIIHPEEDRYLTPRECATIMGFPADYRFSPGTKAYAEVGRGLCTHNAAFLGRVLMDGLERNIRTVPHQSDGSWMEVIDWRRRAKRLASKPTQPEIAEWWRKRYGTDYPEVP